MKKYIIGLFVLGILTFCGRAANVQAHFLITDQKTGFTAEFHAAPDDDPIAGDVARLSFDFSAQSVQVQDFDFTLSVKEHKDEVSDVPFSVVGNVLLADYVFPQQGQYDVALQATPKDKSVNASVLSYSQRVSRGTLTKEQKSDGMLGVFAAVMAALVVVALIIGNSKTISKWYQSVSMKGKA